MKYNERFSSSVPRATCQVLNDHVRLVATVWDSTGSQSTATTNESPAGQRGPGLLSRQPPSTNIRTTEGTWLWTFLSLAEELPVAAACISLVLIGKLRPGLTRPAWDTQPENDLTSPSFPDNFSGWEEDRVSWEGTLRAEYHKWKRCRQNDTKFLLKFKKNILHFVSSCRFYQMSYFRRSTCTARVRHIRPSCWPCLTFKDSYPTAFLDIVGSNSWKFGDSFFLLPKYFEIRRFAYFSHKQ